MRTRIGTQVILGAGIVMAIAIGLTATVSVRTYQSGMIAQLTMSADQLSETVKNSTRDYMLENHREKLHRQIQAIGGRGGIERVRLFNKEGRIMFSSDEAEIGRSLDKKAEACYACHTEDRPLERVPTEARSRIFQGEAGGRVLGIVNPIQNQEGCWSASCHAHSPSESVLGVLDVTLSLAEVDRAIARAQARMALMAVAAIAVSSTLLWWLNRRLVLRPVETLVAATRRVAEGDLTTTIPATARHELGDLARSFNEMMRHLAEARRQVTQSDKLASVGRLAAGVAHEINNPLTGVLTYASFLLKRANGDPEVKKDLEVIVRETMRCRDIVKGMLDFARQTPPRRQPVDLNEVARRAVAVVMNQLSLSRVALSLDLAPDLPDVPADSNQMQQVMVNLLLNAADSLGGDGGTIRLATRRAVLPPSGHAPIRRAQCPRGCDLLDAVTRIRGLAGVHVTRICRGRESAVFMDPVYGRASHVSAEPCEEGIDAIYTCPRCRTSLMVPDHRCAECGAAAFAVESPGEGRIEWCTRKGCHWSRWTWRETAGDQPVVELQVEDGGCGISVDDQQHLFEPFFTTKGRHGTGLGLAVTWGIVESHGGTIDVESEVGRGSRFTVRLPLASEKGDAAARTVEPAATAETPAATTAAPGGKSRD